MAALSWKALPDEVLAAIARLLLGFELLRLSHVDCHLLRVLSRAELYAPRLSHVRFQQQEEQQDINLQERIANVDSKRDYARASLLRFIGGQSEDSESRRLPQSYAPVFWSTDTLFGLFAREDAAGAPRFTLDAWFSLSPPQEGVLQGGILLGLQSEKYREDGGRRAMAGLPLPGLARGCPKELDLLGDGREALRGG